MSDQAAVIGTFVKVQTMADGTPRIVIDLQCSLSEIAALGLVPGVPFAIARLEKSASVTTPAEESPSEAKPEEKKQPQAEVHSNNTNSRWVALRCKEPVFWDFLSSQVGSFGYVKSEEEAAQVVRVACNVDSRSKLDTDPEAEQRFHEIIRKPYIKFVQALGTAR
jgi:hypothetical protein